MVSMCWKCGRAVTAENPIGRSLLCESCGTDLRSCRNCVHWSPSSYHECAERVEDEVRDKERSNFCGLFRLNPAFRVDHPAGNASAAEKSNAARTAFDGLFG